MPQIVDAQSGNPILLITHHYRVADWQARESALVKCPDVQGNRIQGWERLVQRKDSQTRCIAAINPGRRQDRLEVFYRTEPHSREGRTWFEALAGTAVKFLFHELTDPKALAAKSPASVTKSVPAGTLEG